MSFSFVNVTMMKWSRSMPWRSWWSASTRLQIQTPKHCVHDLSPSSSIIAHCPPNSIQSFHILSQRRVQIQQIFGLSLIQSVPFVLYANTKVFIPPFHIFINHMAHSFHPLDNHSLLLKENVDDAVVAVLRRDRNKFETPITIALGILNLLIKEGLFVVKMRIKGKMDQEHVEKLSKDEGKQYQQMAEIYLSLVHFVFDSVSEWKREENAKEQQEHTPPRYHFLSYTPPVKSPPNIPPQPSRHYSSYSPSPPSSSHYSTHPPIWQTPPLSDDEYPEYDDYDGGEEEEG